MQDAVKTIIKYMNKEGVDFLTVYDRVNLPNPKARLMIKIKNAIQDEVSELATEKNFDNLESQLEKMLSVMPKLLEGIVAFIEVNPNKKNVFDIRYLMTLLTQPKPGHYYGKIWDLTQAMPTLEIDRQELLVLDIHKFKASFLKYRPTNIEVVKELEYFPNKEYQNSLGEKRTKNINVSTYSTFRDPDQTTDLKNFLSELVHELSSYKFNRLYVQISKPLLHLEDYLQTKVKTQLGIDMIKLANTDNFNAMHTEITKLLIKQTKVKAETGAPRVVTKLTGVLEAARQGKIKELAINPTLEHIGYVRANVFPYAIAKRGSRFVKNLKPWLVKRVLETGGKVRLISESSKVTTAAKLRY